MGTPMDYSTIEDGYQYIKVFHEANSSNGMLLRKNDKDNNNNNDDNNNDTETISSLSNEQDEDDENSVNEQQENDQQQNEDKVTTCCDNDNDNDNASGDKLLLESLTNEAQSKSITLEAHLIKKSPQVTADNDADTLSECNTNSNWLLFLVQKGAVLLMVTMPLVLFAYNMYYH